jgi:hypothetical protein
MHQNQFGTGHFIQKNDLFGARGDGAEVLHIGSPEIAPKPEAWFGAIRSGADVHLFGAV